jgi:hypothetical protein
MFSIIKKRRKRREMERLVEKETQVVEKEIYVADDGTKFSSKNKCCDYEREQKRRIVDSLANSKLDGFMNVDGKEHADDSYYRWIFIGDEAMARKLETTFPDDAAGKDFLSHVGDWVCIEESPYDIDDIWFSFLSDGIEYATRFLNKFGYAVKIEPASMNTDEKNANRKGGQF